MGGILVLVDSRAAQIRFAYLIQPTSLAIGSFHAYRRTVASVCTTSCPTRSSLCQPAAPSAEIRSPWRCRTACGIRAGAAGRTLDCQRIPGTRRGCSDDSQFESSPPRSKLRSGVRPHLFSLSRFRQSKLR